jgi:hypothetical protein
MDIRKIIREEVNDFDWIQDTKPELKTYIVRYSSEMWIEAYNMDQAQDIYNDVDLNDVNNSINHNKDQAGIRSNEWYDTLHWQELDGH